MSELSQLDFSILESKEVIPKLQEYLDLHMEDLVRDYMVPEIKIISRAMNLPQKFIDGVGYEKSGKNRVKIVNRWGTHDKPLAKWFNDGTRDHGPVRSNYLHWIQKGTGMHIFAKWVHGLPRTNAMQLGMELGKDRFIHNLLLQGKEYVIKELDMIK